MQELLLGEVRHMARRTAAAHHMQELVVRPTEVRPTHRCWGHTDLLLGSVVQVGHLARCSAADTAAARI
jgi:hypothetical protein